MKWKKSVAVLILAVISSMIFGACGGPSTADNTATQSTVSTSASGTPASGAAGAEVQKVDTPPVVSAEKIVIYGVMDPQVSAQQIIADKKGYFADEGLNIENKLMEGSSEMASLISGNTAKVSFESNYTDISLAANGIKVKMLSPVADIGGTQCIVARAGLELTSAKDFEGKKIGMASGAGVLIAIRTMCDELGVDIDKITFVTLDPADQVSALSRGDIDFLAGWEPWVGKAIEQGGTLLFSGVEAFLPEKTGPVQWLNFHTTVQVTEAFFNSNYDDVVKIMRAVSKATDFINENRDEAAGIIAVELNLDKAQVLDIMSKNTYSNVFDQNFVDATNTMAEFMFDMENIPSVPAFAEFGDPSALRDAVPSQVTVG